MKLDHSSYVKAAVISRRAMARTSSCKDNLYIWRRLIEGAAGHYGRVV
jgi:hypothetical protein